MVIDLSEKKAASIYRDRLGFGFPGVVGMSTGTHGRSLGSHPLPELFLRLENILLSTLMAAFHVSELRSEVSRQSGAIFSPRRSET